jgi:DNA-directed RNA polymerase specialized sigma24 family protein
MTSASVKLLRTQSDERLVALAAAGHERAFEAIVERYRRTLLRHCRRYLPEARA